MCCTNVASFCIIAFHTLLDPLLLFKDRLLVLVQRYYESWDENILVCAFKSEWDNLSVFRSQHSVCVCSYSCVIRAVMLFL